MALPECARGHRASARVAALAAVAAAVVAGVPRAARANEELDAAARAASEWYLPGPVGHRDPWPIGLLHLSLPAMSADTLGESELLARVDFLWGSSYTAKGRRIVDAETWVTTFTLRRGVTDDVEVGVEVPVVGRGAGVLDSFIDSFHDLTGTPDGGRGMAPRDRYLVRGFTRNDDAFDFEPGWSLGDVTLRATWRLAREAPDDGHPSIAVAGFVTVPTARSGFGAGSPDLGLLVVASRRWGRFGFHAGAGGTYFTDRRTGGIDFEHWRASAFGAFEFAFSERLAAVGQFAAWTRYTDDLERYPPTTAYLYVGARARIGGWEVDAGLIENGASQRGTADAAFLLGLSRRF